MHYETLNKPQVITNIDDFKEFIDNHSDEILTNVQGESDGWNQKMVAIDKILKDNNLQVSE